MMRRIAVMLHDESGKPLTKWFPIGGEADTLEHAYCVAMGVASAPTVPYRPGVFSLVETLPPGMVPKIEGSPWAVSLQLDHGGGEP